MSAPLAYLFWHWPASGIDRAPYEDALRGFHAALGRAGSVSFRIAAGAPPFPGAGEPLYLDWYPVIDWADLGLLNAVAVSGARRAPHDTVAAMAGGGHGEVRAWVRGTAPPHEASTAQWSAKPAGTSYEDHLASLDGALEPRDALWQRQMVLGVAPELCVLSSSSEPPLSRVSTGAHGDPVLVTRLEAVAGCPGG